MSTQSLLTNIHDSLSELTKRTKKKHILQHLEEVIGVWKQELSQHDEHQRFTSVEQVVRFMSPSKMF
jgi:hypothetical protein